MLDVQIRGGPDVQLLLTYSKSVLIYRDCYKYLWEVLRILELRYCSVDSKWPKQIVTTANSFYFIVITIILKIFICAGVWWDLGTSLLGDLYLTWPS